MKFKIEKNVKIVPLNNSRTQYPFAEMEVGDSFAIPLRKRTGCQASAKAWADRQDPAWRFSFRKIDGKTARVWSVE